MNVYMHAIKNVHLLFEKLTHFSVPKLGNAKIYDAGGASPAS